MDESDIEVEMEIKSLMPKVGNLFQPGLIKRYINQELLYAVKSIEEQELWTNVFKRMVIRASVKKTLPQLKSGAYYYKIGNEIRFTTENTGFIIESSHDGEGWVIKFKNLTQLNHENT